MDLYRGSMHSMITDNIDWRRYDFIDLGCKFGGSIEYSKNRFKARNGVGIDIAPERVQGTMNAGYDAMLMDATSLDVPENCVRFVSMMDFLEHLPEMKLVEDVVCNMKRAAREFLYIRHPSFEDIDYLREFGLKITWTDWHGHPSPVKISEFRDMFGRLGLHRYVIVPVNPMKDSSDNCIVPISAPVDTVGYSESLGGKPHVVFDRPVNKAYDIIVYLPGIRGFLGYCVFIMKRMARGILSRLKTGRYRAVENT